MSGIDPRAELWQEGDVWVSIGKRVSSLTVTKVRANQEYLFFEKAGLRTDSQQVPMHAITDVDSSQSMTQKMGKVGSIRVFVVRPTGERETVILEDLTDYKEGVQHINNLSRAARQAYSQSQRTQHINYGQGGPQMPPQAPPAAPAPASEDVFAQIERLGSLRDKGFISAEDFEAKKADLLSRI